MPVGWRQVAITGALARKPFDCGDENLNQYFRRTAHGNHKKRNSVTFVAVDPEDENRVLGYFTLCPAQIDYDDAPDELKAQFPRFPLSGYRLARLAIALEMQNQGLGSQLLIAAGKEALKSADAIGGRLMFIDAKDDAVAGWYESRGGMRMPDQPLQLVIPLQWFADQLGIEFPGPVPVEEAAAGG